MSKRRALMMIKDDVVLVRLAAECRRRRRDANTRIGELHAEIQKIIKRVEDEDLVVLQHVEARINAIGVAVFDRANHNVAFSPDEGIVWLEPISEKCECPVCQVKSLFNRGP